MASPANSTSLPDSDYGAATGDPGSLGEEDGDFQGPHNWRQRLKPVKSRSKDGEDEATEEDLNPTSPSESILKDEKKPPIQAKEERLDDGRIRERLKSMPAWKKDLLEKKKTRPSYTRHSNGSAASVAPSQIPLSITSGLKRRNTNPGAESAFTQQVVNSQPILSGVPRKKVSPSNSFRQPTPGQTVSGRRNLSNPLIDPATNSELSKKRIERVQRARLYLLQQMGPNSFLIGGDSPDHKFRVIIGPQTCSCGRHPHCVHVLFVMLRVFQVRHNDNCLWSKTLKNYEVENLFRIYHDRRSSRIHSRRLEKERKKETAQQQEDTVNNSAENTSLPSESDAGSMREEEDTCPICLLEMLEGESLLKCENGCHNRLHHHCIAIWFEECRRQNEPLICPLCRAQWKTMTVEIKNTPADSDPPDAPPNTRAPSPQAVQESELRLPHAEPIPRDNLPTAEPWIQVLGEDLVSCLFSRNWSIRETGLKHLSKEVIATLLRGMGEGRSGVLISPDRQATTQQMLDTCSKVLAFMCGDPVYRVFVASLRAMRTMLSYTPCRDKQQQQRLQNLLRPIVDAIVIKCTDGTKRTSQLSVSTLVELAKGQSGELAVGREILNPVSSTGPNGLDGLNYVLKCVTEEYNVDSVQWQWLLGRLYIIEKLLEEFPQDFLPREIEGAADASPDTTVPDEAGASAGEGVRQTDTSDRLLSVARFSVKAVCNAHVRISRMARRVFLLTAKLGAHLHSIVSELEDLLSDIDSTSVISVKRKLARIINDFQLSEKIVQELQHGSKKHFHADVDSPLGSPNDSPISTPRCPSPATYCSESQSETGAKSVPSCPPNTPTHNRSRRKKRAIPRRITRDSVLLAKSRHAKLQNEGGDSRDAQTTNNAAKSDAVPLICVTSSTSSQKPAEPQKPEADDSLLAQKDSLSNTVADFDEHISLCDEEGPPHNSCIHRSVTGCCSTSPGEEEAIPVGSAAAPNTPEHTPHFHTADQETMSSDDLLDINGTSSPDTPSERPVSFKSEVAESPKTSPSHTADQALRHTHTHHDDKCSCKEEVEREEAEALARAMAVSERQDPCPVVPGLTPTAREEVLTIRIQPEDGSSSSTESDQPSIYYENIHWVKGPLLGTGAYSTCYQARDVRTGVLMAVKQISFCRNNPTEQEKVIQAIAEEVQMMARLAHPNVVRIFGATKQGCHFNMFVEWMPGGSLTYLLGRYGSFSDEVIANYTRQILQGLAYLHDNGILHRDLKGANLLVDSTGQRLRIGDFGAAARLASQATGAGEFQGQLLGTIAFMAPEVLRGENYGRACDVWSVGCCMIEMATTKPPWNAPDVSNHLALIFKIASSVESPPIPENLSPAVRDLMLRCLEQSSEFRPTARELLMHPLFTQYKKS
ncbi:mitogen-activated protein kinase kinase kinase 1-like isoform X1 [Haliotis asinina]|uniref:mitogen-activated protein kinase kinase kinase 1-like isoform X1 n=1 Tax=Haliotis asinina TaxID=109174 RepID=UPI00353203C6